MLCTNCGKNPASVYHRKSEGKEITLSLCSDCYKKLYPEEDDGDFFTRFLGNANGRKSKTCPNCGLSFGEFRKTGLLGCAKCYETFRDELIPTIRYIQWEVRHEGKTPSADAEEKYDLVRELVREQDALRGELEKAVLAGDYGQVKKLKERLTLIKKQLNETEGV